MGQIIIIKKANAIGIRLNPLKLFVSILTELLFPILKIFQKAFVGRFKKHKLALII